MKRPDGSFTASRVIFFQNKHTNKPLGPPSGTYIPMHIQIGDPAAADELPLDKIARQVDFAGQLGVLPLLGRFGGVLQAFAIPQLLGNACGRHHFGMDDAALIGIIVIAIEPLVVKP